MMSAIRRSAGTLLSSFENPHACRISSFKSGDTFMTKHFFGRAWQSSGRKYSVLIETRPEVDTEWGVFAGIQTARSGGTTQMPCFARTVITPCEANRSWSSGCACSGIKWPSPSSADTLARCPCRRPLRPNRRRLWHLCDIFCHDSERNYSTQVLSLKAQKLSSEAHMLASGKIVGFIPTKDYDRARAF